MRQRRFELVFAMAALLAFVPAARAQVGLYAAFSGGQLSGPDVPRFYGGTFGGYLDGVHLPIVNFGADLRFSVLGGGGNPSAITGLVGPRAVLHLPAIPLRPYAEALVGGGHVTRGQGTSYIDKAVFNYGFAAGADFTILPRIDWRVFEYERTFAASGPRETMLSTGIVLRIPFL